jgi:hypothetical protein
MFFNYGRRCVEYNENVSDVFSKMYFPCVSGELPHMIGPCAFMKC